MLDDACSSCCFLFRLSLVPDSNRLLHTTTLGTRAKGPLETWQYHLKELRKLDSSVKKH